MLRTFYGIFLAAIRQHDRALTQFEKALAADPSDGMTRWILAGRLRAAGQIDEAIRHFEAIGVHEPDNFLGEHDLAYIALGRKDYAKAQQHFEQVIEQLSDEPSVHSDLAHALRSQNKFREAAEKYVIAAEMDKKHSANLYARAAESLFWAEDVAGAKELALRAQSIDPDQWYARYVLGFVQAKEEESEHAPPLLVSAVEKGLEQNPQNSWLLYLQGCFFADRNQLDRATEVVDELSHLNEGLAKRLATRMKSLER